MKKGICIVVLLIACLFPAVAQSAGNFDDLCKKYKETDGVFTCKINGMGCFLLSLFVGREDNGVGDLVRRCSSCRILTNEGNNRCLVGEIRSFIERSGLEELVSVGKKGEKVKIYVEDNEEVIRRLFVVVESGEGQVFLHIKGKFSHKMIRELMKTAA